MKYPQNILNLKINKMKVRDILFGIAIGDAFAAGIEFQDRNWIRKNVDFTKFVNRRYSINVPLDKQKLFTENYREWDYTDDTEMTIGLINALISEEDFSEDLLVKEWSREYQLGAKTKGFGRNGHGSMRWYFSGKMTIEEVRDFQRNRPNPGNAPAMRSVPIGLLHESLIDRYALINANSTHPNINAIISSQCIARSVEYILKKKGNQTNVIDYCMETVVLNKEYKSYLSAVNNLGNYDNLNKSEFEILCGKQPIKKPYFPPGIEGMPSDSKFTTGSVLYVLKNCANTMDALMKSVNLGGDVDSIASICVGIMAGKYGLESIPSFIKDQVEGREYINIIADKFEKKLNNKMKI